LNKKEALPVRSKFDAAKIIRLVIKFQEKAVDKYFPKFEKKLLQIQDDQTNSDPHH
jgi:hypothetical protein